MRQKPEPIEGVILHAFNFRDYDQIITIFSPEGLIKAVARGANRQKRRGGVETAPLTEAEFLIEPGKSELGKCKEVRVINRHLGCRKDMNRLNVACEILQTLRSSQMPEKAAPDLYALLTKFLSVLPDFGNPAALSVSFKLKTLRHDGHFHLEECLNVCQNVLHQPLSLEEIQWMEKLAFERSLANLGGVDLSSCFKQKVERMFLELYQR